MPKLYVLVGVPGSGKSTWAANQAWAKDCAYIGTDHYVENQANIEGKTCSEVFYDFMPLAVKMMIDDVIRAREAGKDIIWDQTSTTLLSRKKKLMMLPDYHSIAVIFKTPSPQELKSRLNNRPGKIVPYNIVSDMIDRFEMPRESEGFKEIWYAD